MRDALRRLSGFALAASALQAHACTVCDSPTGRGIRAGLRDGHFLHTSLLVVAPFPVFALVVGLLALGFPNISLTAAADRSRPEPVCPSCSSEVAL